MLLVELLHSTNPAVLLAAAQALLELAKVRCGCCGKAGARATGDRVQVPAACHLLCLAGGPC